MIRIVLALITAVLLFQGEATAQTKTPIDRRIRIVKDYNGDFPWAAPDSKESWSVRRRKVREQVLVATGLWPMPEKIPLEPTIHGKIERDGYTIEKVYFASLPGHYVCGNLYRPKASADRKLPDKMPAVLCPHGHWENGRLYEAKDKEIEIQMKQGAEQTREGAQYPLQARCAQLARMGCVVFFYDMVGVADSQQIPHPRPGKNLHLLQDFLSVDAELHSQNFMGLQTFNSTRALDFLLSLPEVDPARVGVTGASGGGTQTFILCAIDDRPAAEFPAVMVSTAMQGGCICENCSYLRVGTGNIELAGLFAPRPLGMSAANDWTKDIERDGLPQLKVLYKMLGAPDNVMAKAYLQFGHNYNQVSRELMYNFFNKHLKLGEKEPVKEQPFVPVPPQELRVFDEKHPLPKDAIDANGVRKWWTNQSERQLKALMPIDKQGLEAFREKIGTALRVMIADELPSAKDITVSDRVSKGTLDRATYNIRWLSRKGEGEAVRCWNVFSRKANAKESVVIWVHPDGTDSLLQAGKWAPAADKILDSGSDILGVEVFRTGAQADEKRPPINKDFAGYTFGYNRPLVAERVHDILTAISHAQARGYKKIDLVGFEKAGPWVMLARALAGNAVGRTAADLSEFNFEQVKSMDDDMMLPGALNYGGMLTLAGLCAPGELYLHNAKGTGSAQFLDGAYETAGKKDQLRRSETKSSAEDVATWLLR
ncbi:MAG: acetylxylan esterase [Planctomycetes bacterium]|nr:acetylxylan esterase [Planctomycetota bacterium]